MPGMLPKIQINKKEKKYIKKYMPLSFQTPGILPKITQLCRK